MNGPNIKMAWGMSRMTDTLTIQAFTVKFF